MANPDFQGWNNTIESNGEVWAWNDGWHLIGTDGPDGGIKNAIAGLNILSKGNFRCKGLFGALGKLAKVDVGTLMSQVAAVAADAASNGYVYDGPSSSVPLDADKFPGAASGGETTVGAFFAGATGREALSQVNGSAIFLNSSDWSGLFSQYVSLGGALKGYGLGTLMHELLHKQMVGGGFTHEQMDQALNAAGAPPRVLGQNDQSSRIAQLCF